jgi:RNA polymerase sigma-70 factor (ECF subfamily)
MSLAQRLEALYRDERQRLFACALAVLGEADAAEDAVHAAFERLLARDIRPKNLTSYAFRTVRNCAHDMVRRSAAAGRVARRSYEADTDNAAADALEAKETGERLLNGLASIDPLRREIIELHLRADLKFREIADALDMPLGTVTSHYRRGLEQLRGLLNEDGANETHERPRTTHP